MVLRLGDNKAVDHVAPLLQSDNVSTLHLVRQIAVDIRSPKLTQITHQAPLERLKLKREPIISVVNTLFYFCQTFRTALAVHPRAIIGFNLVPYGLVAWVVARLVRGRAIISLIGTDYNRHVKSAWYGPLLRVVLRDANFVTIFGPEQKRELTDTFRLDPRITAWLPNAIDTARFSPDLAVEKTADLIYVGRLIKLKRVDLVLYSLQRLLLQRPGSTLIIVGDGPELKALQQLAIDLNLSELVTFLGWSTDPVIEMQRARIFISLSESEGLPMTVIEAMCTGLVPVVTNVGTLSSIIHDNENGLLLSPNPDPYEVADRVLSVLDDKALCSRLIGKAIEIRNDFDYQQASQVWSSILNRLS